MSAGRTTSRDQAGRGDEQFVAGVVAVAVVDHLEAVEIEEEQGDSRSSALGAGQRQLEVVEQQGPVGEPGERVVGGLVGEVGLEPSPLGDVATDDRDLCQPAVGPSLGGDGLPDGHRRAVGRAHPELATPDSALEQRR